MVGEVEGGGSFGPQVGREGGQGRLGEGEFVFNHFVVEMLALMKLRGQIQLTSQFCCSPSLTAMMVTYKGQLSFISVSGQSVSRGGYAWSPSKVYF